MSKAWESGCTRVLGGEEDGLSDPEGRGHFNEGSVELLGERYVGQGWEGDARLQGRSKRHDSPNKGGHANPLERRPGAHAEIGPGGLVLEGLDALVAQRSQPARLDRTGELDIGRQATSRHRSSQGALPRAGYNQLILFYVD